MKQEVNKERLALMFRILREVSGLTQKEIAKEMDITQQSYAYIESGDSVPQLATVIRFCGILKIGPTHFFDRFLKDEIPFTHISAEEVFEISGVQIKVSELPGRTQRLMKMIRILKKMKQGDVATKLSISQQAYCHIETVSGDVSNTTVKRFCEVVGVDAEAFVQFVENSKESLTWGNVLVFITKNSG